MPADLVILREYFAAKRYLLTAHASERAAERGITSSEIEAAIANGTVIEDYPNDKYGLSCLILGQSVEGRLLHLQISYGLAVKVVTVYEPSPAEWEMDFRTRKHS